MEHKQNIITSHGIIIIVGDEALFLQQKATYEYRSIVRGLYTGGKLYHYLSLITERERAMLEKHPFEQWRYLYPDTNMPGTLYRKMRVLQRHLPKLLAMIPSQKHCYDNMLTIPKGQVSEDESSIDAAIRELREETGVCLHQSDLNGMYIDVAVGTDSNMYVTYVYAARLNEKPFIRMESMFQGYMWLSCDSPILRPRYKRMLKKFLRHPNEPRVQEQALGGEGMV